MKTLRLLVPLAFTLSCHLDKLLSGGGGQAHTVPPGTGVLAVTATTSGPATDSGGYTLSVDNASDTIGINDTRTFSDIASGGHHVALAGVPSGCTVGDANPRTVTVPANDTARTTFSVTCAAKATKLIFDIQPPDTVLLGRPFQAQVEAVNDQGNLDPSFTGQVTIVIASATGIGGSLSGTTQVNAVGGYATFSDLQLNAVLGTYTLGVSASRLTGATSRPIVVVGP